MSGKDAYLTAYENNSNDNTAYKEAMKLLDREDVQNRIKELRKPLELQAQTKALTERDQIKEKLWSMINNSATNDSDKLRAMDILNKMNAEYINIQRIEKEETPISELDTGKLVELVKLAWRSERLYAPFSCCPPIVIAPLLNGLLWGLYSLTFQRNKILILLRS